MPKSYKASAEEQAIIDSLICPFCQSECVEIHIIKQKKQARLSIKLAKGMKEKALVTKLEDRDKNEPKIDSFKVCLIVCRSCSQLSVPQ